MIIPPTPTNPQQHTSGMPRRHRGNRPGNRALPSTAAKDSAASASGLGCLMADDGDQRTVNIHQGPPPTLSLLSTGADQPENKLEPADICAHPPAAVMRVSQRLASLQSHEMLLNAARSIAQELRSHGISFEGRNLPVSLQPTLMAAEDISRLARAGNIIRVVLNRAISRFIDEHHRSIFDGPLHRFFTPYYKWWDLIAAERRAHKHIQLMRYDIAGSGDGRWSFMETNTGCPGGTIHCARIRTAWLNTTLGRSVCDNEFISEHAVDDPSGFVRFMAGLASAVDPQEPNIAILNYMGHYTNELESLRRCHAALRSQHKIGGGSLLLGDIRDIECIEERAFLGGKPIALVYNKLNPFEINPHDPDIRGWVSAAKSRKVEFLNSLGAMYLTEAKRSLALLSDPYWSRYLHLTNQEANIIADYVPHTRLLEDLVPDGASETSLPARARRSFVLKADALTRGSGIFIGDQLENTGWLEALEMTRARQGVAQLKCDLASRTGLQIGPSGELLEVLEFFGIDAFFFGDRFAGLVGRSHTSQIFNVGNGGRETPVLIIGERDASN